MATPHEKTKVKDSTLRAETRAAIARAMLENKAHVLIDARPCSIELGRNSKGELVWNIKIYTTDVHETFNTVAEIKKIEKEIHSQFGQS